MRAGWNSAVIAAVAGLGAGLAGFCATARADIVVSQLPYPYGGDGGDSEFLWNGVPFWQFAADDFVLSQPATIRRVSWWSFYGGNDDTQVEPPPPTQTIRLRLYEQRLSDGLPGNVLFEEFVVDPWREYAGFEVLVGAHPPAFRYEVDLSTPWPLAAGTPYWFGVAQMGLPTSTYRWVYSWPPVGSPGSYINPLVNDWMSSGSEWNVAFSMSTIPEPSSATLLAVMILTSVIGPRRRL